MGANKNFLYAVATLIGITVGAGIFALPYGASQSGLPLTIFYLISLTGLTLLINLLYGEIVLRIKERHRFVGYAKIYFGNLAYLVILITQFVILIGVLLIYLILLGNFLSVILTPIFGHSYLFYSLISGIILTFIVILGLRTVNFIELIMTIFVFSSVFIILYSALPNINIGNYLISQKNFFLPIGLILFALAGLNGITEIRDTLYQKEMLFKKAIKWGTILPAILFLIFIIAVFGVSGANTSDDAIRGLIPFLGKNIIIFGAIIGFFAVATSFLGLGLTLRNTLRFDLKTPKWLANFILLLIMPILYFINSENFIKIISFVGGIFLIIEYLAIIFLHQKAKIRGNRQPEYQINLSRFNYSALIAFLLAIMLITLSRLNL